MSVLLIIGTLVSAITFLLLHPQLDKELANRFAYLGIGSVVASAAGFAVRLISSSSFPLFLMFQFIFLSLGVLHVVLIFRYHVLGLPLAGSAALTTIMTAVLVFAAMLGFSIVSAAFKGSAGSGFSACVVPLGIPFLIYQSWDHWRMVPQRHIPVLRYDPRAELPPEDIAESIPFHFFIPRKYTGLKNVRGLFGRAFPASWTLSDAFHETLSMLSSREARVVLDEHHRSQLKQPSEWVLFTKGGMLQEEILDPSLPIGSGVVREGSVIHIRRLKRHGNE